MASGRIRLVTFDALYTLLTPRLPIHIQYAQTFTPFLGELEPDSIRRSFKTALKELQKENPAYRGSTNDVQGWWSEVISRTAVGAGADPQVVDASLSFIVPRLMARFSSAEGYKLYDDAFPVVRLLNEKMNVRTALVSNADSRIRLVLQDLGLLRFLDPVVLSDEAGIEKPSPSIFHLASHPDIHKTDMQDCLHVGDELDCDYHGALNAGMHALLLRRSVDENRTEIEDIKNVHVVNSLWDVVEWVAKRNDSWVWE